MATGILLKAFLLNEYTNEKIPCQYNPEKVALKASTLVDCPATASKNVPAVHHKGFTPLVYTFDNVVFDTYEGPQESMKSVHEEYTSKLLDLLRISTETLKIDKAAKAGSPPQCSFHWGNTWSVAGFMTTCTVNWTLFNSKGTPVRATASFSITQATDEDPGPQNPTSGGEGGQASHVVQPGDTLEHIAYEEWGDPTQWRRLAQANGLENPLVLKPGQRLVIPTF